MWAPFEGVRLAFHRRIGAGDGALSERVPGRQSAVLHDRIDPTGISCAAGRIGTLALAGGRHLLLRSRPPLTCGPVRQLIC